MPTPHLVVLVEEPSMEAFLNVLLPSLLPEETTREIHAFQGKSDLLGNLESRLRGYRRWVPDDWRFVVLVDRDNDDCRELKARLEQLATDSGFRTRTDDGGEDWQVVNRIVIEELEAWYFGDWDAVCKAFPKVKRDIPRKAAYRDPDTIKGGTWEALERILQRSNYFTTGLRKIEAAQAIATHITPDRTRSRSFAHFRNAITECHGFLIDDGA